MKNEFSKSHIVNSYEVDCKRKLRLDHLFMLSELLNVHMEDLLVKKNAVPAIYDIEQHYAQAAQKRFMAYYKKIYQSVA